MKLYDIAKSVRSLATELEDMEMDEQTIKDTLEGSTELSTFEDKAAATIAVLKNGESDIDQIDKEINRLQKMKQVRMNNYDNLKKYLLSSMIVSGVEKVTVGTLTLKRTKNPVSVVVEDEKSIPKEYVTVTITYKNKPDKKLIKKDLQEGKTISGVRLEQTERLVIK